MHKILADENVHKCLVLALRAMGMDVLWLAESDKRSLTDQEIARLANREKRTLITSDSDFIKLDELAGIMEGKVVYIKNRITAGNCAELAERVKAVIAAEGSVFVIDPESLLGFGEL